MNFDAALKLLAEDPDVSLDIGEVGLLLAHDEYPCLDVEATLRELDAMAHEARSYQLGSFEARVHGLCRYLFHDMGFHGNSRDYHDPDNSYLNVVLEKRTGIPISLSAVAMAVGRRVGLQILGVGLPGHFVVKAVLDAEEIIFDPFHGGRVLTLEECEILVQQVTGASFQADATALAPLPLAAMVVRMLNNLKAIYLRRQDFPRGIRIMERLRQLEPRNILQRRDLGVSYVQVQQPGKAIDHLHAYLQAVPEAADAVKVQTVLRQAQKMVAAWN